MPAGPKPATHLYATGKDHRLCDCLVRSMWHVCSPQGRRCAAAAQLRHVSCLLTSRASLRSRCPTASRVASSSLPLPSAASASRSCARYPLAASASEKATSQERQYTRGQLVQAHHPERPAVAAAPRLCTQTWPCIPSGVCILVDRTEAQLLLLNRLLCRIVAGVPILRIAAPLIIAGLHGRAHDAMTRPVT
jgi:hypothetical protein